MALTVVDGAMLNTANAQYTMFKNRLINGAMVIDQRNAGASITPAAAGQYVVDRWAYYASQASKFTAQQSQGAVTPPAGFTSYLGFTSSSAYSVTGNDYFLFQQLIEGYNVADLGWGTANAQTITFSFWVRSSLTGTFGGALRNGTSSRSYPFTYTISVANTWEQKSITVAGDTTGTWATNNTLGLQFTFSLGASGNQLGTPGAWSAISYSGATGQVNVVGTSGATFYITGMQLEKGSNATSFDYRPFTTELQLCQRYYETSYDIGTSPGSILGTFAGSNYFNHNGSSATFIVPSMTTFAVRKRTVPTVTLYSPSTGASGKVQTNRAANADGTGSSITTYTSGFSGGFTENSGTACNLISFSWTASAEF